MLKMSSFRSSTMFGSTKTDGLMVYQQAASQQPLPPHGAQAEVPLRLQHEPEEGPRSLHPAEEEARPSLDSSG